MSKKAVEIESPFLTPGQAAAYLKVKTSTIYAWSRRKKLKFPVRRHGARLLFLQEELKRWSDSQCQFET
jgi:excisionase family DNA binding protein